MLPWRTFAALSAAERRLVVEAALVAVVVRIGLGIAGPPALMRWLDRYARWRAGRANDPADRAADMQAGQVAWAIRSVGRRLPGSTSCLAEALSAAVMLRARGHAPEVRFGIKRRENRARPLAAHAWVECDGRVVVGQIENLDDYAVLSVRERS